MEGTHALPVGILLTHAKRGSSKGKWKQKENVGNNEGEEQSYLSIPASWISLFSLCSISLHVISFVSVCPLPLRVMSHQFDPQSTSSSFSSIRFGTFLLLLFPTF